MLQERHRQKNSSVSCASSPCWSNRDVVLIHDAQGRRRRVGMHLPTCCCGARRPRLYFQKKRPPFYANWIDSSDNVILASARTRQWCRVWRKILRFSGLPFEEAAAAAACRRLATRTAKSATPHSSAPARSSTLLTHNIDAVSATSKMVRGSTSRPSRCYQRAACWQGWHTCCNDYFKYEIAKAYYYKM